MLSFCCGLNAAVASGVPGVEVFDRAPLLTAASPRALWSLSGAAFLSLRLAIRSSADFFLGGAGLASLGSRKLMLRFVTLTGTATFRRCWQSLSHGTRVQRCNTPESLRLKNPEHQLHVESKLCSSSSDWLTNLFREGSSVLPAPRAHRVHGRANPIDSR